MKYSIIICTRNREKIIHQLLPFYQKIEQKSSFEILFIDNNSTDNTFDELKKIANKLSNSRVLFCGTQGLGAAREFARKEARGEILVFTDDDCYPSKDLLNNYDVIFEDKSIAYAGSKILLWDESDAMVTVDYRDTRKIYEPYNFIPAGEFNGANLAIRSRALETIGGFDPNLGAGTRFPCEDIDVVGRLSFSGFKGCYDPRAEVYHHHGRKEADVKSLKESYDKGRGAYYMKMILLRPSRLKTLRFFISKSFYLIRHNPKEIKRIIREIKSAFSYFKYTRKI